MCYAIGCSINIEVVMASTNSILRYNGSIDIVLQQWAKCWFSVMVHLIYGEECPNI
jgi:hypothetical protein